MRTSQSRRMGRRPGTTLAVQPPLGQVADQLAVAVRGRWDAEAHQRQSEELPLPLAWQPADPRLVEGWGDLIIAVAGWPGGPPTDPAGWARSPAGLAGTGDDLADVLARVPTGRLVVLGEPGAGKTTLLTRLLLALLARRGPGGPVPVLVPLAGWNPVHQDLAAWLGRRLTADHPEVAELAESSPPATWAGATAGVRALLEHQLLLPILDGFDQLPEAVRGQAINRLNDTLRPGQGMVLASRVNAYWRAVSQRSNQRQPRGHVKGRAPTPAIGNAGSQAGRPLRLVGAAGIMLQPLAAADVAAYLCPPAAGPAAAARWAPVLARLGTSTPVRPGPAHAAAGRAGTQHLQPPARRGPRSATRSG